VEDGDRQEPDLQQPDDEQALERLDRRGVRLGALQGGRQHRDVGEEVPHEHPARELVEDPRPHARRELPPATEVLDEAAIIRLAHAHPDCGRCDYSTCVYGDDVSVG
jgi:hypothetical protein